MSGTGRPLRFMGAMLGGWIGVRIYLLWPALPQLPVVPAAPRPPMRLVMSTARIADAPAVVARALRPVIVSSPRVVAVVAPPVHVRSLEWRSAPATPVFSPPVAAGPAVDIIRYGVPMPTPVASRWSADAWAIFRPAGRGGGIATPQLGGSQAGARIAYALDDRGHLAVVARAAAAIGARQQDAAIGVEWRPAALPIRVIAERRIAVANARGGFALGATGGIAARPVTYGFRLDGYAQAGIIARDGVEGYADGALRLARPVAGVVDIGIGAWGAAQRGAARLDFGPTLGIALPVDHRTIRLALEWRQRLVGNARPASGPAVSIGANF